MPLDGIVALGIATRVLGNARHWSFLAGDMNSFGCFDTLTLGVLLALLGDRPTASASRVGGVSFRYDEASMNAWICGGRRRPAPKIALLDRLARDRLAGDREFGQRRCRDIAAETVAR